MMHSLQTLVLFIFTKQEIPFPDISIFLMLNSNQTLNNLGLSFLVYQNTCLYTSFEFKE